MALDHYVSQVHLRQFYSPVLGERMYALRKSDLKAFTPNSRSVCRIEEGSTNTYLKDDRAIEEFLKTIEPNYNDALEKVRSGAVDADCVYTIAGFVAYVMSCSPTGMRIHSGPLRAVVETGMLLLDAQNELPPPPDVLGAGSVSELVRSGKIRVEIDEKYPQALGTSLILRTLATFGNFRWEILRNDIEDSPFFTSDFPIAIEGTRDPRVLNRVVPLAPDIAVRIHPDLSIDKKTCDLSFSRFGYRMRSVERDEVRSLNRLIVRCAEDVIFYRDNRDWVRPFISKNRRYRIETLDDRLPTPTGTLLLARQRIVETASASRAKS